ncbi:GGDEF domain-containing protein [Acinetobacter guillouiae]|uniref:GGDEF domain-containing protein n=1 Tax=Acinetobacter guillouiae TaxID=106649 RepID=UPI003341BF22
MGGLLLICHYFFKAPTYLFWLGLGYIVPSFSLTAQSFMSNLQLTFSAPLLGGLYLFGAWASAYTMALRKNASSHALVAFFLIFITICLLVYYAFVDEQLWIRMLILNLSIATVESLVLVSIFKDDKQSDWLNKLVDYSYLFIVVYTFVRVIIIFFFLKNIEASMLVNSVWWLMMLAASIILSMWFAIVLLGTLVRDIILKLNDERCRDPLTHLLNRRGFYDAAKINLIDLPEKQYFLLMCDVDHFKKINDTYGHLVGDRILQSVGRLVSQHVSEKGLVGRFGGEEFIVLLQVEDLSDAYKIAERMRTAIETEQFLTQPILLTASFGLTQVRHRNLASGIEAADKLLYVAKRRGRNCIAQDASIELMRI